MIAVDLQVGFDLLNLRILFVSASEVNPFGFSPCKSVFLVMTTITVTTINCIYSKNTSGFSLYKSVFLVKTIIATLIAFTA